VSGVSNPYEGLQEWVAEVPALVQPLAVALAAMVPYVEGEGSAALGVIAGINPVVAALAGIAGNVLSVLLVVVLGARARQGVLARRSRRAEPVRPVTGARDGGAVAVALAEREDAAEAPPTSRGRRRLQRWLVRFGVPGAALLGPLALPTQLTAATFVASGAPRGWVLLWTSVAIVVWTVLVTAAATGIVSLVGW
jgi:hypothetical protein